MESQANQLGADPEDINDVLIKLESSLGIKFESNDLKDIRTFGELCDIIISKINLQNEYSCTSQQAFYKLREGICEIMRVDKKAISPNTGISSIFQGTNKRKLIKELEKRIGIRLNLFKPNLMVIYVLFACMIGTVPMMFFNLTYGLIGLFLLLLINIIVYRTGTHFKVVTLSEVVEIMMQENYIKARRNNSTINKKEIPELIKRMFLSHLVTNLTDINRDTIIV